MSTLTQATLDAFYETLTKDAPVTRSGRPKFTLVVSRRTSARMDQAWLRGFKRRARRKALKRRFP